MAHPVESPDRRVPVREGTGAEDLEDFFENGGLALHIVDGNGIIVRANRAELHLMGYEKDEYVGRHIALFHADQEVIADILARLARGETVRDQPARLLRKDGSICHVRIDSSGHFRDGVLHHTRCFTRDVTAAVAAQEQAELRARFLDAVGQAVIVTDPDGVITYWNRAAERLYGWTAAEAIGRRHIAVPKADRLEADAAWARIREGEPWVGDVALARRDGSTFPARVSVTPLQGPDGRVVGIIGISEDISDRVRRDGELRDQRDLYGALLRAIGSLGQGLILTRDDRVVFSNEGAARMLGVDEAELREGRYDPRDHLAPGEPERLAKELDLADPLATVHYAATLRRRDGSTFPAEVSSTGLVIQGQPHRLALMRDITELRQSETALDAARRELAVTEKLAALGGLVSGVAHEIRTPLTVIQTNLFALQRRAEESKRTGDYRLVAEVAPKVTAEVESAIERAEALVKSLRRLTKSEPVRTRQELRPAVREAVDLYVSVHRDHAHVLSRLEATPPVLIDRSKVQQVVINLLDNAVQAGPPGSPVTIRTVVHPDGGAAGIVVEDKGIGIPPDVQARMFEPLFTTRSEGTGLGLTIVQRIVHEHGGRIECQSAVGKGATFTVWLPLAPASPEAKLEGRPSPRPGR